MNSIGGRNHTFSRFYRHAFLIAVDSYETSTLNRIFSTISELHFSQGFADKVTLLAKVWKYGNRSQKNVHPISMFPFKLVQK